MRCQGSLLEMTLITTSYRAIAMVAADSVTASVARTGVLLSHFSHSLLSVTLPYHGPWPGQ